MTDTRDPLDEFDPETIATVAAEHDLEADRLEDVARAHQQGVRDLPGVEDIVYEWRSQFHQDPLLVRTQSVYVLALPDHIWGEFIDSLDVSEEDATALRALHQRIGETILDDEVGRTGVMVLVRL